MNPQRVFFISLKRRLQQQNKEGGRTALLALLLQTGFVIYRCRRALNLF